MSPGVKNRPLTESMEMYLKTIMLLERRRKVARVRDIAEMMDVSMSSVTSAMKGLKKRSLIKQVKYDYISLTKTGKALADSLIHKCDIIGKFLIDILEIEEGIAKSDSCLMEHVISQETVDRLVDFMEYVENDKVKGGKILSNFKSSLKTNK